jgi:WD40 repeat protein
MDKSIKVWSATTWITIQTLRQEEPVSVLAFNLDGSLLMSASEDGSVILWGSPTWKELANLVANERGTALTWAFSPDGRNLAVGTQKGAITFQRLRELIVPIGPGFALADR